jgi:hypothetical protein
MLVDVREDPAGNNDNKLLVLTNDRGECAFREFSTDRQDLTFHKLMYEVLNNGPVKARPVKARPVTFIQ